MEPAVIQLKEMVASSDNIVFFGGAGVSTESGIPDFRSVDGLYHQKFRYPPEAILSHTFYERHKEEFFDFYRQKLIAPKARPNAAHVKLAQWERDGKLKAVITQNIDGLHQMAGSHEVLELHGRSCGTTANDAGNSTAWTLSSTAPASPSAAAAAISSQMWCCMRRVWICR